MNVTLDKCTWETTAWPIQSYYKRSNVGRLISVVVAIPLPEVNVTLN